MIVKRDHAHRSSVGRSLASQTLCEASVKPVELLGVDPVASLDLDVQPGCAGADVDVADALVQQVPVERGTELLAVECRSARGPRSSW
jgi:hypothetical protein